MAYASTIDERYLDGFVSHDVGVYDAPATLGTPLVARTRRTFAASRC